MKQYFETNKALWNAKTPHHIASDFYDMDAFLNGESSLREIELELLPDVKGKSLLHLQCHFGQDTLSWAKKGAEVTGIDISDTALKEARSLNDKLGLNAKFVESNVLELDKNLEGKFDIVFTSYGVIGWLPDLDEWARIVKHFLKPGGTFVIVEFHPTIWLADWQKKELLYNYFNQGADYEVETGTYANRDADIELGEYTWSHSLEETFSGLLKQGLTLKSFKEYDFSPYNCFSGMESVGEKRWRFKDVNLSLPYVFSMVWKN